MALTTLVLATAADADVQDRRCQWNGVVWVRAGTPCVILPPFGPTAAYHYSEIIEPPHNGTAVFRADGSIYYSPKPGFTGRDSVRVRKAACNFSGTSHMDPFHDWCGYLNRTFAIFVE
jgi:hypothetical protein